MRTRFEVLLAVLLALRAVLFYKDGMWQGGAELPKINPLTQVCPRARVCFWWSFGLLFTVILFGKLVSVSECLDYHT